LTPLKPEHQQLVPILATIVRKEPEDRRMQLTALSLADIGVKVDWESFLWSPERGLDPIVSMIRFIE
jgi:hypothetical protein